MPQLLIVGNGLSFLGCSILILSGLASTKKKTLFLQIMASICLCFGNLVLGGIVGAVINLIGIIRNIFCYKEKFGIVVKAFVIASSVVLGIIGNEYGIIGWGPILANVTYTVFMGTQDIKRLKILGVITTSMWVAYDIVLINYAAAAFDSASVLTNIVCIYRISKKNDSSAGY